MNTISQSAGENRYQWYKLVMGVGRVLSTVVLVFVPLALLVLMWWVMYVASVEYDNDEGSIVFGIFFLGIVTVLTGVFGYAAPLEDSMFDDAEDVRKWYGAWSVAFVVLAVLQCISVLLSEAKIPDGQIRLSNDLVVMEVHPRSYWHVHSRLVLAEWSSTREVSFDGYTATFTYDVHLNTDAFPESFQDSYENLESFIAQYRDIVQGVFTQAIENHQSTLLAGESGELSVAIIQAQLGEEISNHEIPWLSQVHVSAVSILYQQSLSFEKE